MSMSRDDDLRQNFATDDPARDLERSCYAVTDSLTYDENALFLCFKIETIAQLRGVKDFDAQKFGVALFECFRQPDIRDEIESLQSSQKQIAIVRAENRETGVEPPDAMTAKIPAFIRQGLARLSLCLDLVSQRPSLSRLLDDEFTGDLH